MAVQKLSATAYLPPLLLTTPALKNGIEYIMQDERFVYCASTDRIYAYDRETWKLQHTLEVKDMYSSAIAVGKTNIYAAQISGNIYVWNKADFSDYKRVIQTEQGVLDITISQNEHFLYVLLKNNEILVYDLNDDHVVSRYTSPVSISKILVDGSTLYALSSFEGIVVWSEPDRKPELIKIPTDCRWTAFAQSSDFIYIGTSKGMLNTIEKKSRKIKHEIKITDSWINAINAYLDYIYIGSDSDLTVLNAQDFTVYRRFKEGNIISIMADENYLYYSLSLNDLIVRRKSDWNRIQDSIGNLDYIIRILADDKVVYTVSKDSIIIWDKSSWTPVGHTEAAHSLIITDAVMDSEYIYASSLDGKVYIWNRNLGDNKKFEADIVNLHSIAVDSQNIFVGSYRIMKFDKMTLKKSAESKPLDNIIKMRVDDKHIYAITKPGLYVLNKSCEIVENVEIYDPIALDVSSKYVAVGSYDGHILIFDNHMNILRAIDSNSRNIWDILIQDDQLFVLSPEKIEIWDLLDYSLKCSFSLIEKQNSFYSMAVCNLYEYISFANIVAVISTKKICHQNVEK